MNGTIISLALIGIAVLGMIPLWIAERKRLQSYWSRSCAGTEWRQRFPDAPKEDVRAFLEAFVDAFGFKSKNRLKFSPADRVMDVYRTIYPPGSAVDAMELETFALTLERQYGVDLVRVWKPEETTLGDIFEMTRNPNQASDAPSEPALGADSSAHQG
jgi:hypothetical protein